MFETFLLLAIVLPVGTALVRLPMYLAERRAAARWLNPTGIPELLPAKRARRVTKRELLRVTNEATIDSARRVLVSQRTFVERDALERRVEALVLADIRRSVAKARRTFSRRPQARIESVRAAVAA